MNPADPIARAACELHACMSRGDPIGARDALHSLKRHVEEIEGEVEDEADAEQGAIDRAEWRHQRTERFQTIGA